MNYKTYFRFLIVAPILMVIAAVILVFAYSFPESVNGYYGQLAVDGFSQLYNAQLLVAVLAFTADFMMFFFMRHSREIWILLIALFYVLANFFITVIKPSNRCVVATIVFT